MTNSDIIFQICKAMGLYGEQITKIRELYELDSARFDKNPEDVKELFTIFIGPSRGNVAYKIYKSKTNIDTETAPEVELVFHK